MKIFKVYNKSESHKSFGQKFKIDNFASKICYFLLTREMNQCRFVGFPSR